MSARTACEIWVGNQAIARCQVAAAKITGMPLEKVVSPQPFDRCGFGRRLESDGVARAVQIAKQVDVR
jgi:isoquinoline 1-oxidoreductase beta subunit